MRLVSITDDKALIGAAGVHFVVSELSLRGLVALPTIRNTRGIDVVVVKSDGSWHAKLQVKSSKNKVNFWPVGSKYRDFSGPNNFFVFVRFVEREARFEAFLVQAEEAIKRIDRTEAECRRQGYKKWAPCYYLPKDQLTASALHKRWRTFGSDR